MAEYRVVFGGEEVSVHQDEDGSFIIPEQVRPYLSMGTALKPAYEPICVARKPLGIPALDIRQAIEYNMRKNGLSGAIRWTNEPVYRAAKQSHSLSSIRTRRPISPAETSAANVSESETPNIGNEIEKHSASRAESGTRLTGTASLNSAENRPGNSGPKLSPPMAESVPVAESQGPSSLRLTTSTGAAESTGGKSEATSMPTCEKEVSRPALESFAGTVIVHSDDTDIVRTLNIPLEGQSVEIHQLRDGSYIWPADLPVHRPAQSLTVAENVQKWGVGAMDIDGCRVRGEKGNGVWGSSNKTCQDGRIFNASPDGEGYRSAAHALGRWPANLILDGSEEVLELFPQMAGQSPARFFYTPKASRKEREAGCEGMDERRGGAEQFDSRWKEGGGELRMPKVRNHHPTVKPLALMEYLVRLVSRPGHIILDPFCGSGTTGIACRNLGRDFIGIEKEKEYVEIARRRIGIETNKQWT